MAEDVKATERLKIKAWSVVGGAWKKLTRLTGNKLVEVTDDFTALPVAGASRTTPQAPSVRTMEQKSSARAGISGINESIFAKAEARKRKQTTDRRDLGFSSRAGIATVSVSDETVVSSQDAFKYALSREEDKVAGVPDPEDRDDARIRMESGKIGVVRDGRSAERCPNRLAGISK